MSHGRSQVKFTNSYGQKIYVAYIRRDYACLDCGDIWDVRGWINLDPGETEYRDNPTSNEWFYFYAEAVDGAVWAGSHVAEVTQTVFQKCTCLGVSVSHGPQPYHDVGFRSVDVAEFSGVNFVG